MNYAYLDLDKARTAHEEFGGWLLNLGPETRAILDKTGAAIGEEPTGRTVYLVTDEPEAYRTREQIKKLNKKNNWSEV